MLFVQTPFIMAIIIPLMLGILRSLSSTSPFSLLNMMTKEKEIIMYQKLVQQYKVDFIIKHPLERKDDIFDKSKIIDSHLIAEEIILNLLDRYNVTVIGTYSTVLLNS